MYQLQPPAQRTSTSTCRLGGSVRPARRATAVLTAPMALLGLLAAPAAAMPDPGSPRSVSIAGFASPTAATTSERVDGGECPIARVGTQFVRCDELTGNGVPAPGWIPER